MPSIKLNSLSNLVRYILNIAIGLLLTPFILDSIGKTGYGIWTLIGSFVGYYGLLNLGLDAAIRRYISYYSAQGNSADLNRVSSTALIIFSCTGLAVVIISIVFSSMIANFFDVSPEDHLEFSQLVSIMGITIGLGFPAGVFSAIVTARERFISINIASLISQVIRAILTVIFLSYGLGLAGLGYAALIATLFLFFANFIIFKRYASDIHLKLLNFSLPTLRMMIIFGASAFVIAIGDILRLQVDSAIIGKFINLEMVAVYGISVLLIRFLLSGVSSVIGPVAPRFAFLHGQADQRTLQSLFIRSLSASAAISCLFTFLFLLCGEAFIKLWVGDKFSAATPVLWILSLSYLFDLVQKPGISLLFAKKQHYVYAWLIVCEGIINILCSIALVSEYGIIGVALGTAISTLLIRVFIQPIIVSRVINISLAKYVSTLAPPIFVFSLLLMVLVYFNHEINEFLYSYINLIMASLFLSVIYIGGIISISKQLRYMIFKVF